MGAYREQLLKERGETRLRQEEEPSGFLTVFKIRFLICLVLFGAFSYLWATGNSIGQVSAEQIVELVTDDQLSEELQVLFVNVQAGGRSDSL